MAPRYAATPLTVNTFGRKTTHTQIQCARHPVERDVRRGAPAGDRRLVAQRGRLSVNAARRRSTTSPPRPSAAISRPSSGLGLVRRVHGGAVPAERATLIEAGIGERDQANTEREGPDRQGGARAAAPTAGSARSSTPAPRRRGWPSLLPARPRADGGHPRRADRRPPGRLPRRRPAPAAGPGARRPPRPRSARTRWRRSADLRADVAFLGTNGLTVDHGLSTPDPDEAAIKRAIVAARPQVVVLADASKIGQ